MTDDEPELAADGAGVHPVEVDGDEAVREELRETIDGLIEEHGLPTVFWSLDDVYDEYDQNDMREACEEFEEQDLATDGGRPQAHTIDGSEPHDSIARFDGFETPYGGRR